MYMIIFPCMFVAAFRLKNCKGAMSRGVASQIAQGQDAVFRYGHRLKTWADNTSCFHPRLWCFLVGPVFLTIVLLSVTVNLFWKHSFDHGLSRQHEADESILANFNSSSTDSWPWQSAYTHIYILYGYVYIHVIHYIHYIHPSFSMFCMCLEDGNWTTTVAPRFFVILRDVADSDDRQRIVV